MLGFRKEEEKLVLIYSPEFPVSPEWASQKLKYDQKIRIKHTFRFSADDLIKIEPPGASEENDFDYSEYETCHFTLAELSGEYYKIKKGILADAFDIYIAKDLEVDKTLFIADSDISIFGIIASLTKKDIYIGGDHPSAISEKSYKGLTDGFPTTHEKKLYARARVAAILRNYTDHVTDAETSYNRYMDKKISRVDSNLGKFFKEPEIYKYRTILEKLKTMLDNEIAYTEKQWQEEILQILLLLYPKYIAVFNNVSILIQDQNNRYLDYLLVDSGGNIDIVEIKKPFDNSIISESMYRNNYVPMKELSGAIMQLEKYLFYLNRSGMDGEQKLRKKFTDRLPENISLKITNPGGIIIMGRESNLSPEQKLDFEIIKRKYKNVVDIITYDNLIQRLESIIIQLNKL